MVDAPGSVDAGTTRTDSMDLERRRGITIRAAVTSFDIDDLAVNLVDTPGHPDFIAEVERSLTVLDSAVLVLSSVEGVQPQTVVIWRALQRIGVPTVLSVIDRGGSDVQAVVAKVRRRLHPARRRPRPPGGRGHPGRRRRVGPPRTIRPSARRSPMWTTRCSPAGWTTTPSRSTAYVRRFGAVPATAASPTSRMWTTQLRPSADASRGPGEAEPAAMSTADPRGG